MTYRRYNFLMRSGADDPLTEAEIAEGWHFCHEFDGLLVGPGSCELQFCHCLDPQHEVYATVPPILAMVVPQPDLDARPGSQALGDEGEQTTSGDSRPQT